MNCSGCGAVLDAIQEQRSIGADQTSSTSPANASQRGNVCPLCGRSKREPFWNRKMLLLVAACLLAVAAYRVQSYRRQATDRAAAVKAALTYLQGNRTATQLLGSSITAEPEVSGHVTYDGASWREVDLTIPVHGSLSAGKVHIVGGAAIGPWTFTTFEIMMGSERKKVDLLTGRVAAYDPSAYVDVHTQAAVQPDYSRTAAPPPHLDGTYPCVSATVTAGSATPSIGRCSMATTQAGPVDRFEVDLRYGAFILRQTDLQLSDVFDVPLTRSYNAFDWVHPSQMHAFGNNTNHPYDIAPLGTRNPYTYQLIALEDGDFLYFDRISRGTGYANAVFQHSETSTRFYKATTRWNGSGWTTKLVDGSEILFPESYNAKNMAQGAPTEMRNASGDKLLLQRDPQRNLQQILTPHGHWIKFAYDDHARIILAQDDAGTKVSYLYNETGMLINAANSLGQERRYTYDGPLMTAIEDGRGHVLLRNWYSGKTLIRQQYANGDVYQYEYLDNGKRYADKVRITLPDHSQREISVAGTLSHMLNE